ncbi:MAG: glycosyltransferase family A protein [Alphaproteobacteria bacterium]
MQRPKLSICIPTRNRRLFLARHLRHISKFKNLDYEVVISDNFSSDDTATVAEAYRDELNALVYVRQQSPLNFFETQVAAVNNASGRYTICTSDDDLLVEEGLLRAIEHLDCDPTISAVYGAWEGWKPEDKQRAFKAAGVTKETRVQQRDLIHWYLNASTPELPIMRTDVLHKSHLPFQHQYGFDFYGAAMLTKFGDLLMIPDTTVRVTLHAAQESQALYRPDILQCYLADYELFFSQFAPFRGGVGSQMVMHVLAKQYIVAAERAIGRGAYLMGRDLLLRARVYLPDEADIRLAAIWKSHRLHFVAESIVALMTSMHPVERTFIESGPDTERVRDLVSAMRQDDVVLAGSRGDILAVRLSPNDLVIGADDSLRDVLADRFGFWIRKYRTLDSLEQAARIAPVNDLSVEDYLDKFSPVSTELPQPQLVAGAAS